MIADHTKYVCWANPEGFLALRTVVVPGEVEVGFDAGGKVVGASVASAFGLGGESLKKANSVSWLPDMDLNHDKQIQSLLCYRYTIGQSIGRPR